MHVQPVDGEMRGGGSSWQSLARGTRSIEADYLNGEIVTLGRLHGVPTPANALMQRIASEQARMGAPPQSVPVTEVLTRLA
jgi:2-dehydropantoate 2-reductase